MIERSGAGTPIAHLETVQNFQASPDIDHPTRFQNLIKIHFINILT
jgi:hypothetical protein